MAAPGRVLLPLLVCFLCVSSELAELSRTPLSQHPHHGSHRGRVGSVLPKPHHTLSAVLADGGEAGHSRRGLQDAGDAGHRQRGLALRPSRDQKAKLETSHDPRLVAAERLELEEEEEEEDFGSCMSNPDGICEHDPPELQSMLEAPTGDQAVAVVVRTVKTGYAVTVGLVALGVVTLPAGPLAPALILGGAVMFLAYGALEKANQKCLKKVVKHLVRALYNLDKALQACLTVFSCYRLLLRNYAAMDKLHKSMVREGDEAIQRAHRLAVDKSGGVTTIDVDYVLLEDQIKSCASKVDCVGAKVAESKDKVEESFQKFITVVEGIIHLTTTVTRQMIQQGRRVFSGPFGTAMERWDKVLAAAAVVTGSIDVGTAATSGAEWVGAFREDTAGAVMESLTAAIHLSEGRELLPEGTCGEVEEDECSWWGNAAVVVGTAAEDHAKALRKKLDSETARRGMRESHNNHDHACVMRAELDTEIDGLDTEIDGLETRLSEPCELSDSEGDST